MMEFIRTKYNVYLLDEERERYFYAFRNGNYCCVPKSEVINRANSLEKLCDEFIAVDTKKQLPNSLIDFNDIKEDIELNGDRFEYYGAVWTDKGLIYVTKMNENGELELL